MKHLLQKIAEVLIKRKWYVLIALMITTIVLSLSIRNLKIDNALETWFLRDDVTLVNYNEFKRIYGNDEIIAVWIKSDGSVFDRPFVERIYDISKRIKQNPMIKRVISMTAAPYLDRQNNNLVVEDFVKEPPGEGFSGETLRHRIEGTPVWNRLLFNKNRTATIMFIEPLASADMDAKRPEILKFVKESLKGVDYRLAGMGVVYDELNRISIQDSSIFTLLSFVLIFATLIFLFRRSRLLIASLFATVINLLLFLGVYAFFGQSLNMVSAILPSLIVILGLEDIIFIFANYESFPEGEHRLRDSLAFTIAPCFFTSLTTALGFFAFITSPMHILKSFGLFAAIGVMLEFIVAVIVSAFIISRYEQKKHRSLQKAPPSDDRMDRFFQRFLRSINSLNGRHYGKIFFSSLILLVVGVYGVFHLTVDTYSIDFLLDKNKVKQDSRFFEKDYGFYLPLEIRIKAEGVEGVKDPNFLNNLERLQQNMERKPYFQKATSIVDVVKQLNRVLTDGKESSYRIPDTRNAVAQILLTYELDEDNDLSYLVKNDYSEARLTVRVPMMTSLTFKTYLESAEAEIKSVFGDRAGITFGGYIPLYVKLINYVAQSQISSFIIAFVLIFLAIGVLFRSVPQLLIVIFPNVLPIILTLAFMAATGIFLDIATVTIAAVTIGLSVDNSIHYMNMYNRLRSLGAGTREAIDEALLLVGKPMFISNIYLVVGYLIMLLAHVKSVIFFGALIALTLFLAVLCDIILLPSMMIIFFRDKGKDAGLLRQK
jgi:Predicted exporters of the RND superfamily